MSRHDVLLQVGKNFRRVVQGPRFGVYVGVVKRAGKADRSLAVVEDKNV